MLEFMSAAPSRRAAIVESELKGFGDLNATHLCLCLSYIGHPCDTQSAGSNRNLGSSWLAHQGVVEKVCTRLNDVLQQTCLDPPELSHGETQAAICIWIYTAQTFLSGSNGLHPRLKIGTVKTDPLLDRRVQDRDGRAVRYLKPVQGYVYGSREFLPREQYIHSQGGQNVYSAVRRVLEERFVDGSGDKSTVLVALRVAPQGFWKHATKLTSRTDLRSDNDFTLLADPCVAFRGWRPVGIDKCTYLYDIAAMAAHLRSKGWM